MDRVAIGCDRRMADGTVFVRPVSRFDHGSRTALHRFVKRMIGVLDLKRDIANTVAMLLDMFSRRMLRVQRRCQDKIDPVLPHQIACHLAIACLKPPIGGARKPKGLPVIKLRLLRIADVKLNMMYLF